MAARRSSGSGSRDEIKPTKRQSISEVLRDELRARDYRRELAELRHEIADLRNAILDVGVADEIAARVRVYRVKRRLAMANR